MADKPTTTEVPEQEGMLRFTLEDLRGKTPDELHQMIEAVDAQIRDLNQTPEGELRDLDDDGKAALKLALEVRKAAVARLEEHRAIAEMLKARPQAVSRPRFNGADATADDVRRLPAAEARQRALRVLDGDRVATAHLTDDQRAQIERHIRGRDADMARRILVTENDAYREAFMKLVTHPQGQLLLDDDERKAVLAYEEYRAMSENVTTAGGFGIPVKLAA